MTDLEKQHWMIRCSCSETQMMSCIVDPCPLTKLDGGLSWLHSAAGGMAQCL